MNNHSPTLFLGQPIHGHYAALGEAFSTPQTATPVSHPSWIATNSELGHFLNFEGAELESANTLDILSGNRVIPGSTPVAQAYAGHQFGYFNPQLGDGRAILLGEVKASDGLLYDIQLKGSGPTPYSRNGDGRSAIGPVIREYLVSEAMYALGIPTSRSLAAVASGDWVVRQGPQPGGVLTRVARSHLRVGTFEYLFAHRKHRSLKILADFAIQRHYPELQNADHPYSELLKAVARAQAHLVSQWMRIGFIHGVMNTDNFTISGETLDYGPCAFMDEYHSHKVFSSIDADGRYAFGNQPDIAIWNLARLGEALSPLLKSEGSSLDSAVQDAMTVFQQNFQSQWYDILGHKIGLFKLTEKDASLVEALLKLMAEHQADFTLTFRNLSRWLTEPPFDADREQCPDLFGEPFAKWLDQWRSRVTNQNESVENSIQLMNRTNPLFIPRNHLIEEAIQQGSSGDYGLIQELHTVWKTPYTEQNGKEHLLQPPRPEQRVSATFCGT